MKTWTARNLTDEEAIGDEPSSPYGKLRKAGRLAKMVAQSNDLYGRVNYIGVLVVEQGFNPKPLDKVILNGYDCPTMEVEYSERLQGQITTVVFRPIRQELPKAKLAIGTKVTARFDQCVSKGHYLGQGVFAYRRGDKGVVTACTGNLVTVKINGEIHQGPACEWIPVPILVPTFEIVDQREKKRSAKNAKFVAGLSETAKLIQKKNRLLDGKTPEFPDRIVLGEGHVSLTEDAEPSDYHIVRIPKGRKSPFPKALWHSEVPQYRLVLERV